MFGNFFGSTKTVFDSLRGGGQQGGPQDDAYDAPSTRRESRQDTARTAADVNLMYSSEAQSERGGARTIIPEDLLDDQWECQACTFINESARPSCEVCGTARPPVPPMAAPVAAPQPAPRPASVPEMPPDVSPAASSGNFPQAAPSQGREKKEKKDRRERRRADKTRVMDPGALAGGSADPDLDLLPPQRGDDLPPSRQTVPPQQMDSFRGDGQPDRQVSWQDSPSSSIRGFPHGDSLGATHAAVSSSSRPREVRHQAPRAQEPVSGASSEAASLGRTQTLPRQQQSLQSQQRQRRQEPQEPQHYQPQEPAVTAAQRPQDGAAGGLAGGRLRLRVLRAFNLRNTDIGILPEDVSDPFVVARVGRQEFKTGVIENNLNPVWNSAQFEFAVESEDALLSLEVFNSNQWHAHDSLGRMQVLVQNLTPGENHTVVERLYEGEVVREDGLQAKLEIEVKLLTREQLAGGAKDTQIPGQQLAAAGGPQQRAPNWVPLPSFHGFGPEAFQAPKPVLDDAPVGRARRLEEYESMAARLGQYDYSSDPAYYPKQEETDKRSWKEDPFYGWRRDLQREPPLQGPGGAQGGGQGTLGLGGRSVLGELNDGSDNQLWHKDPFHGWLKQEDGPQEAGLERIQEARVARELMALPSFQDADVKRFDDHREYSNLHKVQRRERWGGVERSAEAPEQRWREDAFFGWLPGRGPDDSRQATLHRPLEQARLNRLPSFSEDPALRGITGRGAGILRVWINAGFEIAYNEGSGLRGKPSACVRLKVGRNGEQVTDTVPTTHNPCWNAPPMVFEVESTTDKISLEVVDLANPRGEAHLHQYFLGRLELDIREILDLMAQQQQARGQPLHLREELHGSQRRAELDFEVLYEPYDTAAPGPARPRRNGRMNSMASFKSTGSSEAQGQLGMLSVRVVAAYNLVNADSGILGDVSDPYVTLRLGSQQEKQRKRTNTINNNLDPVWNSSPFLFPVYKDDDTLHLEVYDEDTFSADDFLGRITVPLYRIICGQPNRAVRIRDKLQDIQHGELEVEIGFSPG